MTTSDEISRKKLKKGIIVAFEGIDGAGKSTQAQMLCEKLNARYDAILLHEPTNSVWGEKIRALAKDGRDCVSAQTEMEYFFNDRMEDVTKNILPALNAKKIIIMDRYYFSSVAYQGARGIDPTYIEERNSAIAPRPNIAFILDLDPHAAIERIANIRRSVPNCFEKEAYLREVRAIFLNHFKGRQNVKVISAGGDRSPDEISREIFDTLSERVLIVEENDSTTRRSTKSRS